MSKTRVRPFNCTKKIAKKKSLNPLVPFLFTSEVIFGLDLGFTTYISNKTSQIVIKYVSSTVACLIFFSGKAHSWYNYDVWNWVYLLVYFLFSLILRTAKYSPCDFLMDIQTVESNKSRVRFNTFCMFLSILVIKFSLTTIIITKTRDLNALVFPYLLIGVIVIYHSLDVILPLKTVIFYNVSYELKSINKKLENYEVSLDAFLKRFMKISSCYDTIKPFLNRLIVLTLGVGIPNLLVVLYDLIVHIKSGDTNLNVWYIHLGYFTFFTHIILQLCLPAMVAETINTQMAALKIILTKHIILCEEDQKAYKASCVLQYVEKRPLLHKLFNVLPLDNRLPIALFSFCVTYFIVILQFTHLY